MRNRYLKHKASRFLVLAVAVIGLPFVVLVAGCDSQLEEQPFSQITPDNFFNNEAEFEAAASAVYAHLRAVIFNPLDAVEHGSDGIMVPTRGPDWGDGGIWREHTQHTWTSTHPHLNGAYGWAQQGIARANGVLSSLAASDFEKQAQFAAEVRFLRAYYYYWLMDMFGRVPIVVEEGSELDFPQQPVAPSDPPPQNTRKEVFDFIVQELTGCTSDNFSVSSCVDSPGANSVLANLPAKGEVPYGRATTGAGYAFLARLLLNAEIFTGTASQSGISPGTALYEGASAAASQVINSGQYMLADDYFQNFAADNFNSPEIIFAATYKAETGVGYNKQQAFLHYNHPVSATPWNGFTTIAEYYRAYDMEPGSDGEIGTADDVHTDERGKGYLVGRQWMQPEDGCSGDECFSDPNSEPVRVRGSGTPPQLNITLEIPSIQLQGDAQALEAPGARPLKFEIDPNATAGMEMGNDVPIFRLAEIYLIKAEAENEVNGPGAALQFINTVREQRGIDPITNAGQEEMRRLILQERGFELNFEMVRRQDLIRYEFAHGGSPTGAPYTSANDPYAPTFTAPWLFKESSSGHRALYPIPQAQISVNPNLEQNPGYSSN